MARNGKLETTLGDFIVALTDAAERQVHDDKMSYELVAYILSDLIKAAQPIAGRVEGGVDSRVGSREPGRLFGTARAVG